jgi:hypothetical protein
MSTRTAEILYAFASVRHSFTNLLATVRADPSGKSRISGTILLHSRDFKKHPARDAKKDLWTTIWQEYAFVVLLQDLCDEALFDWLLRYIDESQYCDPGVQRLYTGKALWLPGMMICSLFVGKH